MVGNHLTTKRMEASMFRQDNKQHAQYPQKLCNDSASNKHQKNKKKEQEEEATMPVSTPTKAATIPEAHTQKD